MEIRKSLQDRILNLPVSGNGTDLVVGAVLARGVQNGALRPATTTDFMGILRQAHTASGFDTDTAGTVFSTRQCELLAPITRIRAYFSMATADLVTCTQAVTTTTMTVTSLENGITAGFLYVVSGTGAGQTNYITASTSGSCTLKAAFTTSLDTTSKFIKILPRFHDLVVLNSDYTKLSSTDAVGTVPVMIFDIGMVKDDNEVSLDPTKHAALTGLQSGGANFEPGLKFWADIAFRDTAVYTLS